uniref:Uncharacterized protein n=1 Tax=Dromedary stool-associated circular ssDNA virus TaxID=1574422 RepID=A0A0A1EJ59_9VIRU|nr:hypothetical protein [Dromedary stool-associated circular ssDNA virus]
MGLQRYLGVNYVKGRKRSRLAGPHDPARPEIKQYNMLSSTDRDGYTAVDLYPWVSDHVTNFPAGALGAWKLIPLYTPAEGTGDSERVGKSIYLRGIQIRGYIEIRDSMIFPCNWRLVLYRQKNIIGNGVPDYQDIYKNFETMDLEVNDVYATLGHYRHNFYKAMYNNEWNDVGTRQVLAKGRITPCVNNPMTGECSIMAGTQQSSGAIALHSWTRREVHGVYVGFEPIKKIIKCNLDHSTTEDFLYLMLETDFPVGAAKTNLNPLTNAPDAGLVDASLDASCFPFRFNIFVRGYFTDP